MFRFDIRSLFDCEDSFYIPGICCISMGKSKTKSQSSSGTRWNSEFMNELEKNAPPIRYSNEQDGVTVEGGEEGVPQQFNLGLPKFRGLEDLDFDKLEKGLYTRQIQNTDPQYKQARATRREELSQSGLLDSPVQYSEGGAIDQLDKAYLAETQKAAQDASNKTIELKAQELARKTGFDIDMVKLFQTIMMQYADVALRAGQFGQQSSVGSGSQRGFITFGPSSSGSTAE